MGQKPSLNETLHQCVYGRDKEGVAQIFRDHASDINSSVLDDKIYYQLILQQWDSDTLCRFAKLANDDQLAILIAGAVLHSHVVPLAPLFELMRDRERTIEQHQLKHLFLAVCERENMDAVRVFIDNKCYDPSDARPIRAVVRAQLNKSRVNEELLEMILSAHPQQIDNVQSIRTKYLSDAKNDEVRKVIDNHLFKYVP
ncbi:uncharacterized protein TM35_000212670 [Trypanosoma theileri]|uniref:Uncharacterized protein n=1 Tax=Trypanosoma theileri TaxID=67003 RepID=A0A1X0NST0_9TRYP|nr:uncharacterized protein TM35_000212670 [Trypanosoma theileri]ORC87661.1 hypothetical protein TM35_000212670 [Trypanosoma theileri]